MGEIGEDESEGAGLTNSFLSIVAALGTFGPWILLAERLIRVTPGDVVWDVGVLAVHTGGMIFFLWATRTCCQHQRIQNRGYWALTALATFSISCFVAFSVHLDLVNVMALCDARVFLRIATIYFAVVSMLALSPRKAW